MPYSAICDDDTYIHRTTRMTRPDCAVQFNKYSIHIHTYIPSNIRGCQSGTWSAAQKKSEEHLPSSNESKRKTQTNKNINDKKERNKNNKIHMPEKDRRRALDRESLA